MDTFEKLSAIDVSQHIEKKGQLDYLPWAAAWVELLKVYPDSEYRSVGTNKYDDGTIEVNMSVTVNGKERSMWLPVMDHRNKAIQNPSARDVSDAKMRCLVKCIAMHGLGISLYTHDLELPEQKPEISPAVRLGKATNLKQLAEIWKSLTPEERAEYAAIKDEYKMRLESDGDH